jgi:hypothetical protein
MRIAALEREAIVEASLEDQRVSCSQARNDTPQLDRILIRWVDKHRHMHGDISSPWRLHQLASISES